MSNIETSTNQKSVESGYGIDAENTKEVIEKLERALHNPKYIWRTVRGISGETGFSEDIVREFFMKHEDEIVQSFARNTRNEQLYAARDVYRDRVTPLRRLMSALVNRAV